MSISIRVGNVSVLMNSSEIMPESEIWLTSVLAPLYALPNVPIAPARSDGSEVGVRDVENLVRAAGDEQRSQTHGARQHRRARDPRESIHPGMRHCGHSCEGLGDGHQKDA